MWINFKMHFHKVQLQLKNIQGSTIQQAGYYYANALAQEIGTQIQQQMATRDTDILELIQNIPSLVETRSSSDSEEVPEHTENAIATNTMQLEILKVLHEI